MKKSLILFTILVAVLIYAKSTVEINEVASNDNIALTDAATKVLNNKTVLK